MSSRRWSLCASALITACFVLLPWLVGSGTYQLNQDEYILSMILVAVGFNLATGYAGQLTLGPGATFLAGAYACAIVANRWPGVGSLWVMCLIGMLAAAVLGLIMAMPALRIGGFYLAIVTLFVALVLPEVFSFFSWSGGEQGISLVSNLNFVQSINGTVLYEICVGLFLLAMLAVWALIRSKMGRRLLALRSSDELTAAVGVSPYSAKVWAFVISSIPAGLGGAMYVYSQQFVSPTSADASTSIYLVAACILGGMGTLWGPVIGTVIVFEALQQLGGLQQYVPIAFGFLLLVCTLLLPRGVVGMVSQLLPARWIRGAQSNHLQPAIAPGAGRRARDALIALGVVCDYGGVRAVDNVSLTVRPGTVHALIGSNGSGKTTLLNAMSGFGRAQQGSVSVGDVVLPRTRPARIARMAISRTFQTPKVMPEQSVLTNVMLAADRQTPASAVESILRLGRGRLSERTAVASALAALGRVRVASSAGTSAASVPHGGLRLLEVARTLSSNPEFVLLDEPAAGLSAHEIAALREAISDMARTGIGVLLVEHNTSFVLGVADEVTVLHQGRVIAHGAPDEIAEHEEVIAAYLGRSHAARGVTEASVPAASEGPAATDALPAPPAQRGPN